MMQGLYNCCQNCVVGRQTMLAERKDRKERVKKRKDFKKFKIYCDFSSGGPCTGNFSFTSYIQFE